MLSWEIFNWTVLILAAGSMMLLGIRSRKVTTSTQDESGFLLAGQGVGTFAGGCSLVATFISGWAFMGATQSSYTYGGIEILGNMLYTPGMLITIIFIGRLLRKRAVDQGSMTIPEMVANRHGTGYSHRIVHGLTSILTVIFLIVYMCAQIKAIGALCGIWLGVSEKIAALAILSFIVFYTSFGGLLAVVKTDVIMIIGMLIGSIVINTQILSDMSWKEMFDGLYLMDASLMSPTTSVPYSSSLWGVFLIIPYAILWTSTTPQLSVRFVALHDKVKFHTVAVIVAFVGVILHNIPFVGLYYRLLHPGLKDSAGVMSGYLNTYLHPAGASFITLFILFAMKSTIDSLLHTMSSAISHDLRKAALGEHDVDHKKALLLNRLSVVGVGIVSYAATYFIPSSQFLNFFAYLGTGGLTAILVGPVFIGIFWRGNAIGAVSSMIVGGTITALTLLVWKFGWVEGPLIGMACGALTYLLVSKATFRIQPRVRIIKATDNILK